MAGLHLGIGFGPPASTKTDGTDYNLPNGTQPLILMDFVNGTYLSNGSTVAVTDLITADNTYGNWNPATDITPSGANRSVGGCRPTLTGDALSLVINGSTIIYEVAFTVANDVDAESEFRVEMTDYPDFNTYYVSELWGSKHAASISDNTTTNTAFDNPEGQWGVGAGTHKMALTYVNGRIDWAIDGQAYASIDPAVGWTPPPNFLGMSLGAQTTLRSIGMYPAQSAADLPMLSSLGRPTWLPAWADSGVSYEHGQAFFGGSLITDLTSIHGAGFDPTAVTGAGMAVTSTNSNRPSAAGAFLDRLTALDFCFAAHFDTTTIDTVGVVMLIDKPDTGNGVAIEWGAGDGLTANMNVTDFQNGQFNTVGVIHANSEHILVGSNNSDGWLSSLNGETAVLDSPHSTGSITECLIGFEGPFAPHSITDATFRSIYFGPSGANAAAVESRATL
jgi:hypothetical protein